MKMKQRTPSCHAPLILKRPLLLMMLTIIIILLLIN